VTFGLRRRIKELEGRVEGLETLLAEEPWRDRQRVPTAADEICHDPRVSKHMREIVERAEAEAQMPAPDGRY
jgi:hypothetical protein